MSRIANLTSDANRLLPADSPAHNWYRFVLSFPPHLVREYLEKFGIYPGQRVLDPFCGTGTTLVECKKLGVDSVGLEMNPVAFFASCVKTDWDIDPERLVEYVETIAESAENVWSENAFLHELPAESAQLLLKDSISPLPLHKVLILLNTLNLKSDAPYYRHARLALAKAVVTQISNLRFGPEVGVSKPKSDAPVREAWQDSVCTMGNDLQSLRLLPQGLPCLYQADARDIGNNIKPESIDAVITSPPYPNEKDYTRTTRLESVLLGFINNKTELQMLKRGLLRSNTRGVYKGDNDDEWIESYPEIGRIADSIEARRIEMGKTSGFERLYGRVTKLYFGGMTRHLASLRPVLKPGAHLAYVVGDQASYLRVMIRTGHLLADIAASLGYEVVSLDLFRTRLATVTGEQMREEVLVLRWPGTIKP